MINIIRCLNDFNVSLITQPKLNYVENQQDIAFRNRNAHFLMRNKLTWAEAGFMSACCLVLSTFRRLLWRTDAEGALRDWQKSVKTILMILTEKMNWQNGNLFFNVSVLIKPWFCTIHASCKQIMITEFHARLEIWAYITWD